MKRYMIERDIAGIGDFSMTELCGAARASNRYSGVSYYRNFSDHRPGDSQ